MGVNRLVVIGASAGGIEALRTVVSTLPADFPAPVCVVLHTPPQSPGLLPAILSRVGEVPAVAARHGERLQNGRIYVAPPDFHLLIEPGVLMLSKGPRENRFRPAIDPLFRSAAQVYGPATIGVVLSGNLDDGTAGLLTVKQLGGTAVVQDPREAVYPSMPQSAVDHVDVDYCVPLAEVGPVLVRLAREQPHESRRVPVPQLVEVEVNIAKEHNAVDSGLLDIAEPSSYACPECHGVLLRLKEADPLRFRCHTGHAYSADSLLGAVNEGIEESLWTAVRTLEEAGLLLEHMAKHSRERGHSEASAALAAQVSSVRAEASAVRRVVQERAGLVAAAETAMQA
jgi:two-component system, chemotaxis family, protein-glutamate methylesterase/glutaminase